MGNPDEDAVLLEYIKAGGYIKKDCWIKPMHLEYNQNTGRVNIVTLSHMYNGDRGPCTIESYPDLSCIKYAGVWLKCDRQGEELE